MISNTAPQSSIGHVLLQYQLYPEKLESFGKVTKVTTSKGVYALKETVLNKDETVWFAHVMSRLERLNYRQIIPVIPTNQGELTITSGSRSYYLMPWLHGEGVFSEKEKEAIVFTQLGKLHGLTVKQQPFSQELLQTSYESLLRRWEKRRLEMDYYAEEAERNVYLSPFQLMFLTHYSRLESMASLAMELVKEWYEQCLEKKSFRAVLCHSKLDRNHIFYHANGFAYVFNFDQAILDTPARDLAISFRKSFLHTLWTEEQGARWLEIYEQFILLEEEEKKLLASYLLYPEPILQCINAYQKRNGAITELQYVQQLEKRLLTSTRVTQFIQQTVLTVKSSQPSQ